MINIKQIRENYDLITEKDDADTRKLTMLVRAGLFDAKKLPMLKRAMEKDVNRMTMSEKKMLIDLLDSLMSEVLHSSQVYSKVKQNVSSDKELNEAKNDYLSKTDTRFDMNYPTDRELPQIIILKRKAIRVYPDSQKIGLYYSQALDRYVSIPFGPGIATMSEAMSPQDYYDKVVRKTYHPDDLEDDGTKKRKKKFNNNEYLAKQAAANLNVETGLLMSRGEGPRKLRRITATTLRDKVVSGEVPISHAIGAVVGAGLGGAAAVAAHGVRDTIRRLRKPAPTPPAPTPVPVPESAPAPVGGLKFPVRESFKKIVLAKRQIKEVTKDEVTDFVKDMTPVFGTIRSGERAFDSYHKGDYGQAALHAGLTALSGAGDVALATGAGTIVGVGLKGLAAKGAGVLAKNVASKTAAKAAGVEAGGTAAKAVGGTAAKAVAVGAGAKAASTGAKKGIMSRIGGKLATGAAATGAALGSGGSSSTPESDTTLRPAEFGMKVTTNKPVSGNVDHTAYAQRLRNMSRDFMVTEQLQYVYDNKLPKYDININGNTITISSTIAEKVLNLHNSLSEENKQKMDNMLNEGNLDSFKKIISFAIR